MVIRILVLGRTGMLGHMVERVVAADDRFTVRGTTMADRADPRYYNVLESVQRLREISDRDGGYDYIVNCIGITANRMDPNDTASMLRAIRINSAFPHELAVLAAESGVRVIHMSTDGVFSGQTDQAYTEDDPHDCPDAYGKTKSLGEVGAPHELNIRTSIIGPSPFKRGGLWEWVAQQADGATIQGYTNHLWHGVTTRQFAEACVAIMANDRFEELRARGPALHLALNAPASKYDIVCAIRDAIGKRLTVEPVAHPQPVRRMLAMRSPDLFPRGDLRAAILACVDPVSA